MTTELNPPPTSDPSITATSTEQSPVRHRIEVRVGVERVRKAFDRAYRDLAKRARVKGFRPGKTPRSVLERVYGASIAEDIEGELIRETLPDAIGQTSLTPVAPPAVDAQPPRPDEEFTYVAIVEVRPRIELGGFDGLTAKRPRVEVVDADVESELEKLRERHAPVVEEAEGTRAERGHVLNVDFVGRIGGEVFDGGTGKDVELEIGSGQFIPGFEEQLVGACAGDDRAVEVTFPESYGSEELAGKEAVFDVHIAAIKRRQTPELDDEFAKDVGDFDTLEVLRERIRSDLHEMRERAAQEDLRRTMMDSLIELTPFEVPPGMIEQQLDHEIRAASERMKGAMPEDAMRAQTEHWREAWRGKAERKVRERLLLETVAVDQAVEVSAEEIEARLVQIAAPEGLDAARFREAIGEGAADRFARDQLTTERALDFLASVAKVEEVTDS